MIVYRLKSVVRLHDQERSARSHHGHDLGPKIFFFCREHHRPIRRKRAVDILSSEQNECSLRPNVSLARVPFFARHEESRASPVVSEILLLNCG